MTDAYNAGREAGIREAAEVAKMSLWKHGGDDAYSAGMDAGARHQNAQDVSAILALLDAPAPAGVRVQEAAKVLLGDECSDTPLLNALEPFNNDVDVWLDVQSALRALSEDRT